MQISVVISIIAATTCFQYSILFYLLWRRHKDLGHLRTFSFFSASLCVMTLSTFLLQNMEGVRVGVTGLPIYRIHLVSLCAIVALLLQFSTEITGCPLPHVIGQNRLLAIASVFAFLAFTPLILRLPPADTPPQTFYHRTMGPLFIPYLAVLVAGVCSAIIILGKGVRAQREQLRRGVSTGTAYFNDIRLFLIGVLLFLPAGIYELADAAGHIPGSTSMPNARALSVIVLCALTGQLLVSGILDNYRKRTAAENQAQAHLDTMSYAAHQVRANADNILWHLTSTLNSLQRTHAPPHEISEVASALDETKELQRVFNSMLLAVRDSLGAGMNLGPRRYGYLADYVEQLCRNRLTALCRSHRRDDDTKDAETAPPYDLRLHSEIHQPVLFSREGLHHILTILIDNAVKYSTPASPIDVRIWHSEEQVHITVQDYGIGITPGQEEQIFIPYSRGDMEKRHAAIAGNGIGLPLARRIAESLGGTLLAESEGHDCGSRFILSFPLEKEENPVMQSDIFNE